MTRLSHPGLKVLHHPVINAKLLQLRQTDTPSEVFRKLMRDVGALLAYEALVDAPLKQATVQTPLESHTATLVDADKLVFAAILRAGLGLVDGMLDLVPQARVGHVGLYRDPRTLAAVEYYYKMPPTLAKAHVYLADPMLATGHSAAMAIDRIKGDRPLSIQLLCLLAAPEGIQYVQEKHPDVRITTAALDRCLNGAGYILPGLGDAGDRLFGTD